MTTKRSCKGSINILALEEEGWQVEDITGFWSLCGHPIVVRRPGLPPHPGRRYVIGEWPGEEGAVGPVPAGRYEGVKAFHGSDGDGPVALEIGGYGLREEVWLPDPQPGVLLVVPEAVAAQVALAGLDRVDVVYPARPRVRRIASVEEYGQLAEWELIEYQTLARFIAERELSGGFYREIQVGKAKKLAEIADNAPVDVYTHDPQYLAFRMRTKTPFIWATYTFTAEGDELLYIGTHDTADATDERLYIDAHYTADVTDEVEAWRAAGIKISAELPQPPVDHSPWGRRLAEIVGGEFLSATGSDSMQIICITLYHSDIDEELVWTTSMDHTRLDDVYHHSSGWSLIEGDIGGGSWDVSEELAALRAAGVAVPEQQLSA